METKMDVLSTVKITKSFDFCKVDVISRTLKEFDLIFGMAKDEKNENNLVFTIYRT